MRQKLGEALNPYSLNRAYLIVCRNKGSHGIDGLTVESLQDYLKQHGSDLIASIGKGQYCPNPVSRVEMTKDANSKRQLGIPTAVDRVVQQAVHQILSPIYEQQFSNNSFGFRPKRSTHQALIQCQRFVSEGSFPQIFSLTLIHSNSKTMSINSIKSEIYRMLDNLG